MQIFYYNVFATTYNVVKFNLCKQFNLKTVAIEKRAKPKWLFVQKLMQTKKIKMLKITIFPVVQGNDI